MLDAQTEKSGPRSRQRAVKTVSSHSVSGALGELQAGFEERERGDGLGSGGCVVGPVVAAVAAVKTRTTTVEGGGGGNEEPEGSGEGEETGSVLSGG